MESLIDRRCAGCTRECSDALYYKCALNDYLCYESKEEENPLYWGEKCKTCKNKFCNIDKAEKCIDNDYKYYKADSVIEKIELVLNKPKYKAFGFTGKPLDITKELNNFFAENSDIEIISITKLDSCSNCYPGIVVVVREN